MKKIEKFFDGFKDFLETEKGLKWEKERIERKKLYSEKLSEKFVKNISEDDFREVIKSLWAMGIWTNKDYKVDKLLKDNDNIKVISNSLSDVLYSDMALADRYDVFVGNITGIGASMLTEIMAFVKPQKYCIWNDKPKNVLPFLHMDDLLPERVFKPQYQIKGNEYVQCIEVLSKFKEKLNLILENADFIDVDFFFAYIFYEVIPKEEENEVEPIEPEPGEIKIVAPKPEIKIIGNHAGAQKILLELGILLGYETFVAPEDRKKIVDGVKLEECATLRDLPILGSPSKMDTIKHIDVLWLKDEYPIFGIEVEESTDVTKGLLRLYQLRKLHLKPIIVGSESKRKKFENEVKKDPFNKIIDKYKFISYPELAQLHEITLNYSKTKKKLLGI